MKNGVPLARLCPLPHAPRPRQPRNALGLTRIASDFDKTDADIIHAFIPSE